MANSTEKNIRSLRTEPPHFERRFVPAKLEFRAGEGDSPSTLFGYTAKYNKRTVLYKWCDEIWYEEIMPGFFDDVLNDDVRCLKNHDVNLIMGRNKANTLTLKSDNVGLYFECSPDTAITYANDTMLSVKRGDISQCSFAFSVAEQEWSETKEGDMLIVVRKLKKASRLFDVGPVTYAAYEDTSAAVRTESDANEYRQSLEAWRKENRTETKPTEDNLTDNSEFLKAQRDRHLRLLELQA